MNKIIELAKKREKQAKITSKVARHSSLLTSLSDQEVRCLNLPCRDSPLDLKVKDGVSFGAAQQFAYEYHLRTNYGEDILEKLNDREDSVWSSEETSSLIRDRKMTQEQYEFFEKAVDMMQSGDFKDYSTVIVMKVRQNI